MVFCNSFNRAIQGEIKNITILILIDGFLQLQTGHLFSTSNNITILILIDGFLQYIITDTLEHCTNNHNPYFNRWFSAIKMVTLHKDKIIRSQSLF